MLDAEVLGISGLRGVFSANTSELNLTDFFALPFRPDSQVLRQDTLDKSKIRHFLGKQVIPWAIRSRYDRRTRDSLRNFVWKAIVV